MPSSPVCFSGSKGQVPISVGLPCVFQVLPQMVVLKVGMRHRGHSMENHGGECVCLEQIHMLFLALRCMICETELGVQEEEAIGLELKQKDWDILAN